MKKLSKNERAQLAATFDGRCGYCGTPLGTRWCADHMEPVLRQSKLVRSSDDYSYKVVATGKCFRPENDSIDNLMPSCGPCNAHKGALGVEDWRRVLGDSLGILARNYSTYRIALRFGMLIEKTMPSVIFHFEQIESGDDAAALAPPQPVAKETKP
jgi:hypothetical protein